jgi:hypothetical protein
VSSKSRPSPANPYLTDANALGYRQNLQGDLAARRPISHGNCCARRLAQVPAVALLKLSRGQMLSWLGAVRQPQASRRETPVYAACMPNKLPKTVGGA